MARFKRGDFSTCDTPHPGWPKTDTTPGIIDQIHELILDDRRISAKSIAEELGITHERVGSIIHEDLDMRKLSAKWVPKRLNADQQRQQCQSSQQLLEFFRRDPNDSVGRDWWPWTKPGYITITRRQSNNQWSGGIEVHHATKKFRVQKSAGKVLVSIFWDQDGIRLTDYLPNGQTINAVYYSSLLVQLKEKRRGKVNKGVLFLDDNAPAHRALVTQKKLAYMGFQYFDHPPYSPDLAPSDYHLFPGLK